MLLKILRHLEPENLRVGLSRPGRGKVQEQEYHDSAEQTRMQVERGRARHIAKKKSFRSAPRIVSGRESARWTLLTRLASAMYPPGFSVGQEPGNSHARKFTAAGYLPGATVRYSGSRRFYTARIDREVRQPGLKRAIQRGN